MKRIFVLFDVRKTAEIFIAIDLFLYTECLLCLTVLGYDLLCINGKHAYTKILHLKMSNTEKLFKKDREVNIRNEWL